MAHEHRTISCERVHQVGEVLAFDCADVLQAGDRIVPEMQPLRSTPANQPSKRSKLNEFCSRVSITTVAPGVRSCVPQRSAKTGIEGCNAGTADMCHARGDLIRVVVRLFIRSPFASCRYSLPAIFVVQSAENSTSSHLIIIPCDCHAVLILGRYDVLNHLPPDGILIAYKENDVVADPRLEWLDSNPRFRRFREFRSLVLYECRASGNVSAPLASDLNDLVVSTGININC